MYSKDKGNMNTEVVNGEIMIEVPEGFRVYDKAELDQAYTDSNPDRWGMTNDERHIVVSVFWHKNNALVVALAGSREACKGTEKKLSKGLKNHGYVLEGFYQRDICGQKGHGFRHRYNLNGEEYISEVTLFMKGRVCYTVYCYTRSKDETANRQILSDIVDSMSF
jgi:hypothetical protein